jgi:hypothetical protein
VALEPELEEIASLWPPAKRFEMARKFRRWARQLRITGLILFYDSHPGSRPALRIVSLRKAQRFRKVGGVLIGTYVLVGR